MATQSLYRRYRPRRFSELWGQGHIVQALRSSVEAGREGQAYLFSGPRGTGKTTTARIMAKVLNCENPEGGEPCCECTSCVSVEQGTSYDVHELDAASNNGVDAMRDLIEKASLGTPGRHRVYILDEVHMLSKGAEAALLKTLEEPPPHVVFVLATTDPQKMSDTIRSRTQHLQFHLLSPDTLLEPVRRLADDAGLTVTDEAIEQVISQGAGSPRDTLSALELVSNSGGAAVEVLALDEFVEAMIESDPGRALKMAARAISRGRDPRTITEELVGFLRNGFLALMAPELVQLPSQRLEALTDLARRLGPPGLVRGIELLGAALTEMRNAPDPRVLLDVAIVQLTSVEAGGDVGALTARLARLERQVAAGAPAAAPAAAPGATPAAGATPAVERAPAPAVDPATGRAKLGSRLGAAAPSPSPAPAADPAAKPSPAPPTAGDPAAVEPSEVSPEPTTESAPPTEPTPAPAEVPAPEPSVAVAPTPVAGGASVTADDWSTIRAGLKGMTRARFAPAEFVRSSPGSLTISLPNEPHRDKCEGLRPDVEAAASAHSGTSITVEMVVAGDDGPSGGGRGASPAPPAGGGTTQAAARTAPAVSAAPATTSVEGGASAALAHQPDPARTPEAHLSVVESDPAPEVAPDPVADRPVVNGRAIADQARAAGPAPDPDLAFRPAVETLPDDDEVDLSDLVDAPPDDVKTPMDRLGEAFPGSTLVEEDLY